MLKLLSLRSLRPMSVGGWRNFQRCGFTVHSRNADKTGQSKRQHKPFLNDDQRRNKENIMSRTKVVVDESESADIVASILKSDDAIAVDMEGVQLKTLGLIQVKSQFTGNIYLFRTGRNAKLFTVGGLKEMLESPNLIKVMHASTGDCMAIYKEGIKLWNLYDTAVAQQIISYQNSGAEITTRSTISFNGMCDLYGFDDNPLKAAMHGSLWRRQNDFLDSELLPEDLIYYSACDVHPLLDIYEITRSLIQPDFQPLFQAWCERELIRCIDPDLCKSIGIERRRSESKDVFIYGYESRVTKPDIYSLISKYEGMKEVFSNTVNCCSHVIFSNRASAILLQKDPETLKSYLGPNTSVRLVKQLQTSEVEAAEFEHRQQMDRLKEENYIVNPKVCSELVNGILKVKCPVVVDFHLMHDMVTLELFVGRNPSMKFDMSKDMIQGGLGALISSPDVVKIIPRLDTSNTSAAFRACCLANFRPSNFFDLGTAFKVKDYLLFGQSIYKTTAVNTKEISSRCGIFAATKFENFIYVYLYLTAIYPAFVIDYLAARSRVECDIASNVCVAEAKEARKQLRMKYETKRLHVIAKGNVKITEKELKRILEEDSIECNHVEEFHEGKRAVVELVHHIDMRRATNKLNALSEYRASAVDLKTVEVKLADAVNIVKLDRMLIPHLDNLTEVGFFEVIAKYKEVADKPSSPGQRIVERSFSESDVDTYKSVYT